MDAKLFRDIMGGFATGVTIVSTRDPQGRPYGLTVNSLSSVSLEPLLILICLHNRIDGFDFFLSSRLFGVSILSETQVQISNHFATPGTDRSHYLSWSRPSGIPLVRGCLAYLECQLEATYPGGDHTIFLGRVTGGDLSRKPREPLLFYRGQYRRLKP